MELHCSTVPVAGADTGPQIVEQFIEEMPASVTGQTDQTGGQHGEVA